MAVQHRSRSYASYDAPVEGVDQYSGENPCTDPRRSARRAFLVARARSAAAFDAALEAKGWSNRQVARWVGVTFKFVHMMRTGLRAVPAAILEELKRRGLALDSPEQTTRSRFLLSVGTNELSADEKEWK